jgi:hypothetical protein
VSTPVGVNPDLSPAELMMALINGADPSYDLPLAIVGPANDSQQQVGVISIIDAGLPVQRRDNLPIVWVRSQFRCLAGTVSDAERIGRRLASFLDGHVRTAVIQESTEQTYLIHGTEVSAGPSMHFDTPETWEALLFTESMIGTEPIP